VLVCLSKTTASQATLSATHTSEVRNVARPRGRRGTVSARLLSRKDTPSDTETSSTAQEHASSNTRSDPVYTRGRSRGGRGPGRGPGQGRGPIDTRRSDSKEEPV